VDASALPEDLSVLQPEEARARRLALPQSMDLVAFRIDEDVPVLSKWERGLLRPGRRWDRISRKLSRYLDHQERKLAAKTVAS